MPEYISVREASRITGYATDYVRELIRNGAVEGRKVVTVWQVDKQSLLDYARRQGQLENQH